MIHRVINGTTRAVGTRKTTNLKQLVVFTFTPTAANAPLPQDGEGFTADYNTSGYGGLLLLICILIGVIELWSLFNGWRQSPVEKGTDGIDLYMEQRKANCFYGVK